MTHLSIPNIISKTGHLVDIDKRPRIFHIMDEIVCRETNNPNKVIYLQHIQFPDNQKIV